MVHNYRNITEVANIEAGALWRRQDDMMILEDEDQFVKAYYNPTDFEPVNEGCQGCGCHHENQSESFGLSTDFLFNDDDVAVMND